MTGYICLVLTLTLTALGQLCQKQAALCLSNTYLSISNLSDEHRTVSNALTAGHTKFPVARSKYRLWLFGAMICLATALITWLNVLTFLPISVAYPMLSLNFVIVAACSRWFYKEEINLTQTIGIFLIMLGVGLLAT